MKALPKQINKTKMVELYSNQMSAKSVLEELRGFQEQCEISIHKSILHDKVKQLFFKRFGLPTGYEMTEETKLEI
jgi:hypothetical protein